MSVSTLDLQFDLASWPSKNAIFRRLALSNVYRKKEKYQHEVYWGGPVSIKWNYSVEQSKHLENRRRVALIPQWSD